MNRLSLGFAFSTLLAFPVFGQNPNLQITLSSGEICKGVSIDSLKDSALTFTTAGSTRNIPLDSVVQVRMRGSSDRLRPMSIGLFLGAATGFLAGSIIDGMKHKQSDPIYGGSTQTGKESNFKVALPIVCGGAGALIGYISARRDTTIELGGKSIDEKKSILMPLLDNAKLQARH